MADAAEPAVRALLAEHPRMPATVIAERIGWPYSMTTLKDRLRQIRREYLGVDPVDRIVDEPGEITSCDLWFAETKIPVRDGQTRVLPVLGEVAADHRSRASVEDAGVGPRGRDRRDREGWPRRRWRSRELLAKDRGNGD